MSEPRAPEFFATSADFISATRQFPRVPTTAELTGYVGTVWGVRLGEQLVWNRFRQTWQTAPKDLAPN